MNQKCSQCGYIHPPIAAGQKCPVLQGQELNNDIILTNINLIRNDFINKTNGMDETKIHQLTNTIRKIIITFS